VHALSKLHSECFFPKGICEFVGKFVLFIKHSIFMVLLETTVDEVIALW